MLICQFLNLPSGGQSQKNFLPSLQSFLTQNCANSYHLLSLLVKEGKEENKENNYHIHGSEHIC